MFFHDKFIHVFQTNFSFPFLTQKKIDFCKQFYSTFLIFEISHVLFWDKEEEKAKKKLKTPFLCEKNTTNRKKKKTSFA